MGTLALFFIFLDKVSIFHLYRVQKHSQSPTQFYHELPNGSDHVQEGTFCCPLQACRASGGRQVFAPFFSNSNPLSERLKRRIWGIPGQTVGKIFSVSLGLYPNVTSTSTQCQHPLGCNSRITVVPTMDELSSVKFAIN